MKSRIALAFLTLLVFAGNAAADDQLVAQLKTLGKAVDDMTANISTAGTDAEAQLISNAVRQALDKGLKQDRPTITLKATAGYCAVTIETVGWKLWSEARGGKVVKHGAKIN